MPPDPQSLFRNLPGRSSDIQHLWAHQDKVLSNWHSQYVDASDIALELPTGTGKTLVALLIAEFVRQTKERRVAYLCPNRQLAYQVGTLADNYSIDARVLVGRQADYDPEDYNAFEASAAVAVTTYSAIFNTNPKIDSANLLILDDAHASADFISSLWSVDVDRNEHEDTYFGLLDIFADVIPAAQISYLRADSTEFSRTENTKIPSPIVDDREVTLRGFLDSATVDTDLKYPWSKIRGHLHACHVFVTWASITIRPVTPPTFSHAPFADASQRIYMSATLGEGGELERITGVSEIERLPVPEGWDREGTGRRFIFFPNWSLPADVATTTAIDLVAEPRRSLILTPNKNSARSVIELLRNRSPTPKVFSAADIENTLDPFLNENHATLVLNNRYDGLDLPGETCHLAWICGLPGAVNAQEAFLLNRLKIYSLFRDRIRTRLTQALGRCTRNPTDHSLVIISEPEALDFCNKKENRSGFHPEIQAEIQYGLNASIVETPQEFIELARAHLEQLEGWEDADQWIREERDSLPRQPDAIARILMKNVKNEVEYADALWVENYQLALEKARRCADRLGGDAHRVYRAWWYYLAASVAAKIATTSDSAHVHDTARDLLGRACSASPTSTWFTQTAQSIDSSLTDQFDHDPQLQRAAELIENRIQEFGVVGNWFESEVNTMIERLDDDNHTNFEQGLEQLGRWLGVPADRPSGRGVPDGVWPLLDDTIIAFEAKSEENPGYSISLDTTRQAQGHINWVKQALKVPDGTPIYTVVVSDRATVADEALPNTQNLYVVELSTIRDLGRTVVSVVRSLRAQASATFGDDFRREIADRLTQENLDPASILEVLRNNSLGDFPVNS